MSNFMQILEQMAQCTVVAKELLWQLHARCTIPQLPDTNTTMMMGGCFRIPLKNGFSVSVAIPADKNRYILPGKFCIETALFKANDIVYEEELGYGDVRVLGVFDNKATKTEANDAIEAEYHRLMTLLSAQQ